MISEIYNAALEPFTTTIGWQAFAYGATGKIVLTYAKNFIEEANPTADKAVSEAEEEINQSADNN